ncbi:hypothetical protein PVA17_05125 [Lysinibacillus sp. CNPSo 3705]|uniref:hypothetical protein n=1 Tax=Lysinibacillus sp. CNPSo 3705 TaxID=3028148 RepID=UPI002363A9CC|nr:hypothetical protein [Lysinibacillus sp. CNPSo 3705]MDD1502151.1 hypothetical protein [Lysinibacillus sp. CNPSo 3705]
MRIQSTNNNYIHTIKKGEINRLSPDLFLDKKKEAKAKYEIIREGGYLRHYVTNLNGERVLIKETKLPKGQDTEQSTGGMTDVLLDNLFNQFTKTLDHQKSNELLKNGIAGQKAKEKLMLAYRNSI